MRWPYLLVIFSVVLSLLFIATSCTRLAEQARKPQKEPQIQTVIASFYDQQFAGKTTANGEVYDPNELTTAHRSYPFGTVIKVTNAKNRKSVHVRVNDRGPFRSDRSLDLSQRAAREIGIEQSGVSSVQIEVIERNAADDNK